MASRRRNKLSPMYIRHGLLRLEKELKFEYRSWETRGRETSLGGGRCRRHLQFVQSLLRSYTKEVVDVPRRKITPPDQPGP